MRKKYNTPHRSRVVKTRLSEDEYADFTARLAPYGISQSEFLRQAIRRATIRPVVHVSSVNDELLSAVGKLTAEYGRIGGNLNQIARYLNEYGSPYNALSGEVRAAIADLAALKYEVLKKVGDAVGEHSSISTLKTPTTEPPNNTCFFEHDEFTMKPVLDESGRLIPREDYRLSTLNCGGEDFAVACMRANLRYGKNQRREDVKSHHYIISFDPRDGPDNGLTVDRAQALGEQFCKEHFPGHQALVCTHPDGQ